MDNKYYIFRSSGFLNTFTVTENNIDSSGFVFGFNLQYKYFKGLPFPVEFNQIKDAEAKKLRDVIEMRAVNSFLISENLRTILIENHITGWDTYDVIVKDKKGNVVPGYYGFLVCGKNPRTYKECSGEPVPDIFRLSPELGCVMCTQKVKALLEKNRAFDICDYSIFERIPVADLLPD